MATARLEQQGEGRFALIGDLDFAAVAQLERTSGQLFAADAAAIVIDLARVERANSSGVALLLAWLIDARRRGRRLQWVNTPPQMAAMMQLVQLDNLIAEPQAAAAKGEE